VSSVESFHVARIQELRQALRELECENARLRTALVALERRGDLDTTAKEIIEDAVRRSTDER